MMDGSILTNSLKAALTGGKLYMFRTRDYRAPAAISFPLRQARDWQSWLISAKLWTNASSQQLRDELDSMIHQGKDYRPSITFETPRSIQEAAAKHNLWEPEVSEEADSPAIENAAEEAQQSDDDYMPSGGEEEDRGSKFGSAI